MCTDAVCTAGIWNWLIILISSGILQKINIYTLNLSSLTHHSALYFKPVQTVVAYMETVPYRDPVAMDQCVWQMEIVMVRVIIL